MSGNTTIVWFRDDLRVADNPALSSAVERGGPVVAVYVLDEVSRGIRPLGGASKWWLHESLLSLEISLSALNVPLVLRSGPAAANILEVVDSFGATSVVWNRRYGAGEMAVDAHLKAQLRAMDVLVESFQASLLFEPWTISTGQGTPYSVFTPFWRACLNRPEPREPQGVPHPVASTAQGRRSNLSTESLQSWGLQPSSPGWAQGLRDNWVPGEDAAHKRLQSFLAEDLEDYAQGRDTPSESVTSRLSPHLRWGELSPQQVWHEVGRIREGLSAAGAESATRFLTEIGWREFAWHVLFHFPQLAEQNWRAEYDAFPWPPIDQRALQAWKTGTAGLPLVDAGMRELWATGTMHNRVRMVVASFLTKNLQIHWRAGEEWFWDTLVDADAACNPFNWQWVAGSGADAAPYFRIFNPELQARKFDPHEIFIRQYVPEFDSDSYPEPIVDLAQSRRAALEAHKSVTQESLR